METIILFNEHDKESLVFTYNAKMLGQLEGLAGERPEEVRKCFDNGMGGAEYSIPKKWVKIRAPRIMSEERRAELAKRMANIRNTNSSTVEGAEVQKE